MSESKQSGLARVLNLFRQVNMHKVDEAFSDAQEVPPSVPSVFCRVCEESVPIEPPTQENSPIVLIHMYLMTPGDKLHVHGIGKDMEESKLDAGTKAADLLVSLDPEIFALKKARLRARLKDFGFTLPKSDAMKMLESANDPLSTESKNFPKTFKDLIMVTRRDEDEDDEEDEPPSPQIVQNVCESFLRSIPSYSANECIEVFNQIGLTMVEELNRNMNEFVFIGLILLTFRVPMKAICDDEKTKLSFLKIFEQIVIFNADQFVVGERLVGKLLRYYLSEKALPYIAKNRLEMLTVFYSMDGRSMMKVPDEGLRNYETEDSKKLAQIVESKTPPKEYLDLLFTEFSKINLKIFELFNVNGQIYGSLVNGFPTNSSDIDVVINLSEQSQITETSETMNDDDEESSGADSKNLALLNKLYDSIQQSLPDEFELSKIDSARVPILKCKSRTSQVEIDVSFNHEVVVHNSALLRAYSSMSAKVGQLVVLVKHWAKQRDLNDALQGTLSSYSYVLLVIHYLQMRKMLPDLQNPPKTVYPVDQLPTRITDGGRCSTWFLEESDTIKYKTVFAYEIQKLESVSLKNLFVKFFEYYLYDFNFITDVATVTSIHSMKKREAFILPNPDSSIPVFEYRTLRRRTWFTIKDPFEIRRFLGTTARGTEIMVREMRRAVELLLDGHLDELFEPFKNRGKPIQHPVPVRKLIAGDSTLNVVRFTNPFPRFSINPKLYLDDIRFCSDVVQFLESLRPIIQFGNSQSVSFDEVRALLALTPIGLISAPDFAILGFNYSNARVDTAEINRIISLVKKHVEKIGGTGGGMSHVHPSPQVVVGGKHIQGSKKLQHSQQTRPAGGGGPPPPSAGGKGKGKGKPKPQGASREIGTVGKIGGGRNSSSY